MDDKRIHLFDSTLRDGAAPNGALERCRRAFLALVALPSAAIICLAGRSSDPVDDALTALLGRLYLLGVPY